MAEIDKGLPNVRQNVTLPSQEELTEVTTEVQNLFRHTRAQRSRKMKMVQ